MICSVIGFLMTPFKTAVILPVSSLLVFIAGFCFSKNNFNGTIYSRMILTTGISAVAALIILTVA